MNTLYCGGVRRFVYIVNFPTIETFIYSMLVSLSDARRLIARKFRDSPFKSHQNMRTMDGESMACGNIQGE